MIFADKLADRLYVYRGGINTGALTGNKRAVLTFKGFTTAPF